MKEHNVAGATVAISCEGKLVYSRGLGWADVTKQIPTLQSAWNQFCRFGPAALVAVIVIPMVMGRSSFSAPMHWTDMLIRMTTF